jgi:hypothetical protein
MILGIEVDFAGLDQVESYVGQPAFSRNDRRQSADKAMQASRAPIKTIRYQSRKTWNRKTSPIPTNTPSRKSSKQFHSLFRSGVCSVAGSSKSQLNSKNLTNMTKNPPQASTQIQSLMIPMLASMGRSPRRVLFITVCRQLPPLSVHSSSCEHQSGGIE